MFLAERTAISSIDMSDPTAVQVSIEFPMEVYINAVDGNAHTQTLYFTDLTSRSIKSANYDGSNDTIVGVYMRV